MKKRSTRTELHSKYLHPLCNKSQSHTYPAREYLTNRKVQSAKSLHNHSAFNDGFGIPPAEPVRTQKRLNRQIHRPSDRFKSRKPSSLKMADQEAKSASNFPVVDSKVLQELKDADAKATKTSKLIESMKKDIIKFSKKKDMTDEDLKQLKNMHEALNEKLSEFEKIANNVQRLLGLADLTPESLAVAMATAPPAEDPCRPPSAKKEIRASKDQSQPTETRPLDDNIPLTASEEKAMADLEEKLPKVIVCNTGKEEVPKIIVCEAVEPLIEKESLTKGLAEKLCNSYKMQEKLATEAAEMEGSRYQLQEELLTKDRRLETLQKQVECLQTEMKFIAKENAELHKKLLQTCQPPHPPMCKRELYMKFAGSLPEWDNNPTRMPNKDIEKFVEHMEGVVDSMKCDIGDVQAERRMLQTQTQMLQCAFTHQPTCMKELAAQHQQGYETSPCVKDLEGQLRFMNEKYNRLNCDFNDKIAEIACLRTELKNERCEIEQLTERCCYAEARADDLLERLKIIEIDKRNIMVERDQFIDIEQQLCISKQHRQNLLEENETLQCLVQEQANQVEEYKEKYMGAQQTVEEQKRIVERMHIQSLEIKEQLLLEVQQFKVQIKEKLNELSPLPEKLRLCSTKLQISQQNIDELSKELIDAKETIERLNQLLNKDTEEDERAELSAKLAARESELDELKNQNCNLKATVSRFEELTQQNEWQFEEKISELTELSVQLSTVREESARQIVKTKERCETIRKLMTAQICVLEKQLAESRAAANAATKERDEIRCRMQQQVTNLNDYFGQAQLKIKNITGSY